MLMHVLAGIRKSTLGLGWLDKSCLRVGHRLGGRRENIVVDKGLMLFALALSTRWWCFRVRCTADGPSGGSFWRLSGRQSWRDSTGLLLGLMRLQDRRLSSRFRWGVVGSARRARGIGVGVRPPRCRSVRS